jgi:hypothetical protein
MCLTLLLLVMHHFRWLRSNIHVHTTHTDAVGGGGTKGYKGVQRGTKGYKGVQRGTKGYKYIIVLYHGEILLQWKM